MGIACKLSAWAMKTSTQHLETFCVASSQYSVAVHWRHENRNHLRSYLIIMLTVQHKSLHGVWPVSFPSEKCWLASLVYPRCGIIISKMKLLLVACLVAVCSAAPPVPNIAQAFCGSGDYKSGDYKSGDSKFGKCIKEKYILPGMCFG